MGGICPLPSSPLISRLVTSRANVSGLLIRDTRAFAFSPTGAYVARQADASASPLHVFSALHPRVSRFSSQLSLAYPTVLPSRGHPSTRARLRQMSGAYSSVQLQSQLAATRTAQPRSRLHTAPSFTPLCKVPPAKTVPGMPITTQPYAPLKHRSPS